MECDLRVRPPCTKPSSEAPHAAPVLKRLLSPRARSCTLQSDGCISSSGYPNSYPNNDFCNIQVSTGNRKSLQVLAFNVEAYHDRLVVDGFHIVESVFDDIVPQDSLQWTSVPRLPSSSMSLCNVIFCVTSLSKCWNRREMHKPCCVATSGVDGQAQDGSVTASGWKICLVVTILSMSCDFESTLCSWLASNTPGSMTSAWTRVNGADTNIDGSGWYLRAASNSSQDVVLESVPDMVITDKLVAFSFGFQISGSEATTLQLDCQASENSSWLSLWTQHASQISSSWQDAIVVVPAGTARLRLLARLAEPSDMVGLDSVQTLVVVPSAENASCNFDEDACGWICGGQASHIFSWCQGESGPSGQDRGFLPFPRARRGSAILGRRRVGGLGQDTRPKAATTST